MSRTSRRRGPPEAAEALPDRRRARALSRRRFMTLLMAASAGGLIGPARRPDAAPASAPARRSPPLPETVRAEIEKQKKIVADALKVIRDYPLTPGSDMAFEFRPMRRGRRR